MVCVCAKSHYRTAWKGWTQDHAEDRSEGGHRMQLFASSTASVLTQGQETLCHANH